MDMVVSFSSGLMAGWRGDDDISGDESLTFITNMLVLQLLGETSWNGLKLKFP